MRALHALSTGDVDRLRIALRLLLAPFEYSDTTAWRLAVCQHLLDWLDTDAVELTLTRSGDPPMVIVGRWGMDTVAEYMAVWHGRQEVDAGIERRGLDVWFRDGVTPRETFRRTAYFNEFCSPKRILDSGGARDQLASGEDVILHLNSSRAGTFTSDGRTATVLQLLQPALAPAVSALAAVGDSRRDWKLLDAAPGAVALLTMEGRLLHATPRLAALLRDQRLAAPLTHNMRELACETWQLVRHRRGNLAIHPSRRFNSAVGPMVLMVSVVDAPVLGALPLCLLTVSCPLAATTSGSQRSDFQLTERETQVARLLALGTRNAEIATELRITEHTARRHTERVLAKLGVRSRAAVATALATGAPSTTERARREGSTTRLP